MSAIRTNTNLSFPARLLAMLALITVLLVGTVAWTSYAGYRDLQRSTQYLVELEHCRGLILQIDETLTMSARMAVATNETRWIDRYNQSLPQLNKALVATSALAQSSAITNAVAETAKINTALVSLERNAFSLLKEQQGEQAQLLLNSPAYDELKARYLVSLGNLVGQVQKNIDAALAKRRQQLFVSLALAGVFTFLFMLQIAVTARRTRQWQDMLVANNQGLAQAKDHTQNLNQELERRVDARTQALLASKQQLYSVLNDAPIVLFALDSNGVYTLSEGAGLLAVDLTPGELIGQSMFEIHKDNKNITDALRKAYAGQASRTDARVRDTIFSTAFNPIKGADGQVTTVIGIAHDVTARHASESRLSSLSQAVAQHPAGIAIVDLKGEIQYVNPNFAHIMGQDEDKLVGYNWYKLRSQNTTTRRQTRRLRDLVASGYDWQGEFRHTRPDGKHLWLRSTLAPLRNANDEIHQYLYMVEDISEQREVHKRLDRQTNFDVLTGLPNRKLALEHLNARLGKENNAQALILIDLDNFKRINDAIGHEIGDQLLIQAAKRISTCTHVADTVARIGGDEFFSTT